MPQTITPIELGSPGEDISKKDIQTIIQRFKSLNQLRQQRVQSLLQKRQHIFLPLLPLLFHQNHPLLPGFISLETPTGIQDYKPNKQEIDAAKHLSRGYTYKPRALLSHPIQGIYIMGSVSSIAFSKTSDIDIWLCHHPDLSEIDLDLLQQKATAIEKWAESLSIEAHFFLIDSTQFSRGKNAPISTESSGSTQHHLLLEEFYRTAIFIAGRIPAWWLVPPNQEHNYTHYLKHLIDHRFIDEKEIVNFGGLESIAEEEFLSSSLWHIYKSINAPHKSLLKLFLMESYASEYPNPKWLCFTLKQQIYQGNIDLDYLDPYLLIYEKVERYLQATGSIHRLELVRLCLFLKIMGPNKIKSDSQSKTLRFNYMKTISKQWHWPEGLLNAFNQQKYWDIKKATQEHIIIRIQLKHSLRVILKLASHYAKQNYRENKDLKLISRKLYAFLEKKPRKIEVITTRSSVHAQEQSLSIVESSQENNDSTWALYLGNVNSEQLFSSDLIKQEAHLLNLLGWLVINGLYHKHLHLHFISHTLSINSSDIQHLLNQLFQLFEKSLNKNPPSLNIYQKPDKQLISLVIINLGQTLTNERDDGMLVVSERSDPLSYGKDHQCFIQTSDHISVSIWGEVITHHYEGLDGLLNCLTHIFNHSKQPVSIHRLKVACYTLTRAHSISQRIQSIFSQLITYFSKQPDSQSHRYFLTGENAYYVFKNNKQNISYFPVESTEQLLQELASTQEQFGYIYFDTHVLDHTAIPFLYSFNQEYCIQIFYLHKKESISIFVIDEKGALFTEEHKNANYHQVLNSYFNFLDPILNHPLYGLNLQLKFYKIQQQASHSFSISPAKWTPPSYSELSLRIIVEQPENNNTQAKYFIYCNDQEFNSDKYGEQVFNKTSKFILNNRKEQNKSYPIYISHLEAPCRYLGVESTEQLQTIHHLQYKKKIEYKLNAIDQK